MSEFGNSGFISDSIPEQGHSLSMMKMTLIKSRQQLTATKATKRPAHSMTVELLLEIKRKQPSNIKSSKDDEDPSQSPVFH